jgi:glycosyltransferase involved in cell wall biosynthesis
VDVPGKPLRGERSIHLHYIRWQRLALAEAHRLHAVQHFDIVHHVSWGTVNAPPELWRLGVPFLWGPIGGGQAAPLAFARYLGWQGFLREAARTARRHLMPFLPSLRHAVANSAIILATNRETVEVLRRAGALHVEWFSDGGVGTDEFIPRTRERRAGDRLELVWAGRLKGRKALPLALAALACVRDVPIRLKVAGSGPLRTTYERQVAALGLTDSVQFLGSVPRDQLLSEIFPNSDAFLFTSLQDSFGTVVIEAMAGGLPVIALDHQGVGTMIPEQAAIKVPVKSPASTIRGLADGIRALAASPNLGRQLSHAACSHAANESWRRRAIRMDALYRRCLELRTDVVRPNLGLQAPDDSARRRAAGGADLCRRRGRSHAL